MIKNERQYRITKSQAQKFAQALEGMTEVSREASEIHPLIRKAQEDALRSQLTELRQQLEEYESLLSGLYVMPDLQTIEDLPRVLIQARISRGLSQKDLAEGLGVKEQQIQRYEATDYASASLARVKEVIKALNIKIQEDILPTGTQISPETLFNRLGQVGLDREFVLKRLIPLSLADQVQSQGKLSDDSLYLKAATAIGRIFDWKPTTIFGSNPLKLNSDAIGGVRFKVAIGTDELRLNAYTIYAHYLALVVSQAVAHIPMQSIPTDPYEVRGAILSEYGSIKLESVLRYVWSLGIPVIALDDPRAFHGACFRENGRNTFVVKQKTSSPSRWMFDILHELWHAAQDPELPNRVATIEADEMALDRRSSEEERVASQFAGAVLLGRDARRLAEVCVNEANQNLRLLKSVVETVAAREGAPLDALANYLAFHLSLIGKNWWGTAANLQEFGHNPWLTSRNILFDYLDVSQLNKLDLDLLQQALAPWEVPSDVTG